jgi:hypothetical protein
MFRFDEFDGAVGIIFGAIASLIFWAILILIFTLAFKVLY